MLQRGEGLTCRIAGSTVEEAMVEVGARAIGARVMRVEDPRILTGRGRYVDDVVLPGMLHAAFVRSTVPHGRSGPSTSTEARALPGVVAVYTGDDMARLTTAAEPAPPIGMNDDPGHAGAGRSTPGHRQGPLRRRSDRPRRRREPLRRRGRRRAHRRGHRRARRRSPPTTTPSTRRSRRSSTSSTTTSSVSSEDDARRRRRRVRLGRPGRARDASRPPSPDRADGVPRARRRLRREPASSSRSTRRPVVAHAAG